MIRYDSDEGVCYECMAYPVPTVHFGEEPDYDRKWLRLCRECLEKALAILNEEEKEENE